MTRETGRNSRPAVSNDGKRIALSRWRPGANQDIWIVDADGGNAVQRTTDAADDDYPHWFPGDRRLGVHVAPARPPRASSRSTS